MYFIDQIYLESAASRRVLHVVEQVTRIVDFRFGCCVNLDQVDKSTLIDFPAGAAGAARLGGDACFTIQRFGKDPGNRRFTDTTSSRKQVGVMQAPGIERIDKRLQDVFLADGVGKRLWPPFARQNKVTHS